MGGDAVLEFDHFDGVAVEKTELVELGPDGALEPAHGVVRDRVAELVCGEEEFFAEHGEAFSVGRDLGGDVVGPRGDDEVAILVGFVRKTMEGGGGADADDLESAVDLELLDILGEVAARHAFVNVLVSGEVAELLDASLHIMAGDPLAGVDGSEVDLINDTLVGGDGLGRNVESEIALCFHHRDPELAFETDFSFRRPDRLHGGSGVAFSEDVGDHGRRKGFEEFRD